MARRFKLRIGDHLDTPDGKRYYTDRVFSEIAPRYDFITRVLSFWRDSTWKRDLIAALPPIERPVCVDLACGTGGITLLLAKRYPEGRIAGLDIAAPMLALAGHRGRPRNVLFVRQDMDRLGIAGGAADIVTGGYALRNAPDLETALEEIRRVLKPGGVAAFLDFSKPAGRRAQWFEYLVLSLWGGFWGILFHGNQEVYGYIAESLRRFPDRDRLRQLFRHKGFDVVCSRRYFFGVTELLVVRLTAVAPP